MRRRLLPGFVLACSAPVLMALGACEQGPVDEPGEATEPEEVATDREAIINGSPDNENKWTCAFMRDFGGGLGPFCTATIIGKSGDTAYAISAAHCDMSGDLYLVCADTYDDCPGSTCKVYPVTDTTAHPQYDGSVSFDVLMITLTDAADADVIQAAGASDGLNDGAAIEVSGYGVTNGFSQTPSDRRNHAFGIINTVYLDALEALQSHDGPYGGSCNGDSGGPMFSGSGASKRIVGITSQGDKNCDEVGYYVRMQYVWDFISGYMGTVQPPGCEDCVNDSLSTGACGSAFSACYADLSCRAIYECQVGCGDQACIDACVNANPAGGILFTDVFNCSVCTECAAPCGNTACGTAITVGAGPGATATVGAGGASGSGGSDGDGDEDEDEDEDGDGDGDGDGDRADGAGGGGETGGCDCSTPGNTGGPESPALLLGAALAIGLGARRRRRA